MSRSVHRVVTTIRDAEQALSEDVHDQQRQWRSGVRRGRVWFDKEVRQAQKRLKQGISSFLRHSSVLNLLTTPIIYSLCLPFVFLDFWVSLYQWICFPIYGIERVQRRRYFAIDRHKLAYLNAIEKANCLYCSYANGVIAYVREVAARTEQYWCPIKHARSVPAPHSRYQLFFDYGDAAGYRRGLPGIRRILGRPRSRPIRISRGKR
jgi:hypothetical protein